MRSGTCVRRGKRAGGRGPAGRFCTVAQGIGERLAGYVGVYRGKSRKNCCIAGDGRPPAGVIASTILGSEGLDLRATATDCEV